MTLHNPRVAFSGRFLSFGSSWIYPWCCRFWPDQVVDAVINKNMKHSAQEHIFLYIRQNWGVCVCVYWNPNKKGTNHGNKSVWCLTAALWVLFGRVELHIMCLSIIKIIIINTSYSPRQPLCLDRPQYKPHPLRLFAIMMSVTASNTTWMFPVSVAQVRWQ